MKILALDLGTKTGYALEADNYPLSCGTVVLACDATLREMRKTRGDRRGDVRFFKLIDFLRGIATTFRPDIIVFEDVQFATTSIQAHLWATWRAAVWLVAHEFRIAVDCCPVATLKKFATGRGNAKKEGMAAYLIQNPRFKKARGGVLDTVTGALIDDNAVDALHLLRWAKTTLR